MENRLIAYLLDLPRLLKYLMVLGVIVFISFLYPNNVRFKYEFAPGQSWRYDDLNAPFDFAVLKANASVQQEVQRLSETFSPYYAVDMDVLRSSKQQFRAAFQQQLDRNQVDQQYRDVPRNPDRYLDFGLGLLERFFEIGIPRLLPDHQVKGDQFVINLRKGNTTEERTLQSFFRDSTKLELQLTDSLFNSGLPEADFLLHVFRNLFKTNIFYSSELTDKFLAEKINAISPSRGMVRKDELIIQRDGIITEDIYQKLLSYQTKYEQEVTLKKSHWGVFIGYLLLTSLIVGVFILYLQFNARKVFNSYRQLLFMLLWLVVYSYVVFVVESNASLSVYMVPFCIVPIIIKIFYDERLALFTHVIVVLLASFLSSLGYEFTFLQILAGIVALLANIEVRDWSKFFFSILYIFLAYSLGYLGLSLIVEGSLQTVDWSVYTWIFLNVFLTLLAYPLIPLLERFFGFTSSITLVELSDMNRPLLRDLSLKAPGTMQHSLQVANLAEAAVAQIGGNTLLVKVAALYHDIGKMLKPQHYIENLQGESPHNQLSNEESAQVIIEHVTEGVRLARKHSLPPILIDFIETHHGTTRVEYFYRKEVSAQPDGQVEEQRYRYPGPRPITKEQAVLMMADSIEAASKSLKSPTEKDIDELVEKIVAGKITKGQLDNAKITFQELELCKIEFKKLLKSIYHVRIEYPDEE